MKDDLTLIEPHNEMGVISIFSKIYELLGFSNLTFNSTYPDATAIFEGKQVNIEFEYNSNSFITHRHNPEGCDFIICWYDDIDSNKIDFLGNEVKIITLVDKIKEFGYSLKSSNVQKNTYIKFDVNPESKRNFYVICHALDINPQDMLRNRIKEFCSQKKFKKLLENAEKVKERGK